MGKKILCPRFPTRESQTSNSQRVVGGWHVGLRAGASISIYIFQLLPMHAGYHCPCQCRSVTTTKLRQQRHGACQRLCLTWPVWTVLHLHFTVLCAGRVTLLGYAWLTWLAPKPICKQMCSSTPKHMHCLQEQVDALAKELVGKAIS